MASKRGGKRPGAGRPAGAQSRATRAMKASFSEVARTHAPEALRTLVQIAKKGESDSARVSAANAILDRAYGKPSQAHEHAGPNGGAIPTIDVTKLKGMTDTELEALERALVQIGIVDGDPSREGSEED